jgi:type IV secretion system protein TrbJ
MNRHRPHAALAAGVALLMLATASTPARAQWIVFDPTNYAQNVLTAARELQQVNNEIQGLKNQATMLINQARNLASLPYSSLNSLEQSITQTQQLLTQAQRIAYSVSTIDQAFTQIYPQADLVAAASRRRAGALAERARRIPGRDARPSRRRAESRLDPHPDRWACLIQPIGHGRTSGRAIGQPARRASDQAARRSYRRHGLDRPRPEPRWSAPGREPGPAQQQLKNFLNYGAGYQPGAAQMFH